MSAPAKRKQRVECDHCGYKVYLNEDGTYRDHESTSYRVDHNFRRIMATKTTKQCENSGKRYAFHMGTFRVIERQPNGKAITWIAECRCGESWTAPDYDSAEAPWAEHNKAERAA